jgi:glycosyltransferase involved in cell wall biosynthesis
VKPRIFIAMASGILGGPGKGLVQFLRHGGLDACQPVIINYATAPEQDTEFTRAFRDVGAKVFSIRQHCALDFGLIRQGLAIARSERCDILQSHGYKSHVLCAAIHLATKIPWIAFVHGWTSEDIKVRCYHALEKCLVPAATRVVAVSESLKLRLPQAARRKTVVIPNAVDRAEVESRSHARDVRAEFGIAEQAVVAGVVGRLSPEKGQLCFLRALALVRREFPTVVGLLVGDGQDRAMLEAEAKGLGLEKAVFFAGHTGCVGDFYRAMDVVVMPSVSEGMPNVALEAMMFGKPVVASRVGGMPEVVVEGETGFMVKAGDADTLASALMRMLTSSSRMQAMGEAGRCRVLENFSPTVRAERLLALYERLLLA